MYLVPNKISGNSIPHFAKRDNEKPRLSGDSRGKAHCYWFTLFLNILLIIHWKSGVTS